MGRHINDPITKGVYCLTSPSGKRYVGVAMCKGGFFERWSKYKKYTYCIKGQTKIFNAIKKYGVENIKFDIILSTNDLNLAYRVENQLIALWNLQSDDYGYNISPGGIAPMLGRKHTKESKERMKSIKLGTCIGNKNPMFGLKGELSPNYGRKATQECKEKLSKSLKETYINGRRQFNEYKIKIKNILTNEEIIGYRSDLSEKLGFSFSNLIKFKKAKKWVLLWSENAD